jgi:hypothetical protein
MTLIFCLQKRGPSSYTHMYKEKMDIEDLQWYRSIFIQQTVICCNTFPRITRLIFIAPRFLNVIQKNIFFCPYVTKTMPDGTNLTNFKHNNIALQSNQAS